MPTFAALNGLKVKASSIGNTYLTSPCEEKIGTKLGPEFREDSGKMALIVRALYRLKSAGALFGGHLVDYMRHLGYQCCKVDVDLWFKVMIHPDDGTEY